MPSARHVTQEAPLPATAQEQQRAFAFPRNAHLLITTPRHIFAWDAAGVNSVFQSSKGGIVAAREAKDGSGLLAVASRNVVVMHDTKRMKGESWGLNAPQEEVRHLEFSNDAKSLFLSTTSDGTIQHYSTERSRLLDPPQRHASSPVAVAVSPTGHMILSASHDPPAIHLKNLAHNSIPTLIHPNASTSPVSCAVFHPERPNVFMLAYKDGTVAAYDASRISKESGTQFSQASVNDGEISHIFHLHRTVVSGDTSLDASSISSPIVGAAFLPGFKTRAVTAGRDGRCRLVDFAKSGQVLRTWHARAPVTSISVFAIKGTQRAASSKGKKQATHMIGGPTTTDSVIAIGRVDGKVNVYDTVGLLLVQKTVSSQEERILSVEWVQGISPKLIQGSDIGHFSDAAAASLKPPQARKSTIAHPQLPSTDKELPAIPQTDSGLGLPPNLRPTTKDTLTTLGRQFTVHPDEVEADTVRYIPSNKLPAISVPGGEYHDLFSPVKPAGISLSASKQHVSSPPRSRPRISSQTFVKNTAPENGTEPPVVSVLADNSHATSSTITGPQPSGGQARTEKSKRRGSARQPPPTAKKRHILFNPDAVYTGGDAAVSRAPTTSHRFDDNAKILADLRGLATTGLARNVGLLSTYGPTSLCEDGGRNIRTIHQSSQHQHKNMGPNEPFMHGARTWPDSSSPLPQNHEEDIWLTSSTDDDTHHQRRRRPRRNLIRPPGRQTPRFQVNSKGTISTTIDVAPAHLTDSRQIVDGSTDQEMITAREAMSPQEPTFVASDNVRQLFPRSSSLSPNKNTATKKPAKLSPTRRKATLTEMAINAAIGRQPKSPWARVKAGRPVSSPRKATIRSFRKNAFVTVLEDANGEPAGVGDLVRSGSYMCLTCPETKARVQALEGEVAHLKGEVLALKAVLRQNGLPFPACLR